MKHSFKTGFSFGLTSAVITTLGLMVGLQSSTHSKTVVLTGILVIAIADALSDAIGIHMSEESENRHTTREIWESTFFTFLTKFVFALTFIVPVLLLELSLAVIVNVVWGLSLITIFSFYISQKGKRCRVILEHLIIAGLVVIATHYIGAFISMFV